MKQVFVFTGFFVSALTAATLSAHAQADGFECQTQDEMLNVKVYHYTSPEEGTRNAAILILSNPSKPYGSRTIARFRDADGTLGNSAAYYLAFVDRRTLNKAQRSEPVPGGKLGRMEKIQLEIDFSYSSPRRHGDLMGGKLTFINKDRVRTVRPVLCMRYLKGE